MAMSFNCGIHAAALLSCGGSPALELCHYAIEILEGLQEWKWTDDYQVEAFRNSVQTAGYRCRDIMGPVDASKEPILNGTYEAVTPTGWGQLGSDIKAGAQGLVGDQWGSLGVTVEFKAPTNLLRISNNFGASAKLYTGEKGADGTTWTDVMTLSKGMNTLDVTASYIKLFWETTSREESGNRNTVEFFGRDTFEGVCRCLSFLVNAIMRMAKWIDHLTVAQDLFGLACAGLPEHFAKWMSIWETPYYWIWEVDKMHSDQLRPAPGGWWPLEHRGIAPVVRALQGAYPRIARDFASVRAQLDKQAYKSGIERKGWSTKPIWSTPARDSSAKPTPYGFQWCQNMPSVCEALDGLIPTVKTPYIYVAETVGLQGVHPGGFLFPHNDPERVSIMLCLAGCDKAWLKVGAEKRYWGHPGAVLAFDNIVDHSVGNDGDECRWVVNVVITHPDYEDMYDQLQPRPPFVNGGGPYVHSPLRRCALGLCGTRSSCRGC